MRQSNYQWVFSPISARLIPAKRSQTNAYMCKRCYLVKSYTVRAISSGPHMISVARKKHRLLSLKGAM